jgi:hypothetical protein
VAVSAHPGPVRAGELSDPGGSTTSSPSASRTVATGESYETFSGGPKPDQPPNDGSLRLIVTVEQA